MRLVKILHVLLHHHATSAPLENPTLHKIQAGYSTYDLYTQQITHKPITLRAGASPNKTPSTVRKSYPEAIILLYALDKESLLAVNERCSTCFRCNLQVNIRDCARPTTCPQLSADGGTPQKSR